MIAQSNRQVLNNAVKCLATIGVLLQLVGVAMPVQAAQKAISVNFTDTANTLAPGDIAGNPALGSFANWNNMSSGTSLASLTLSDGTTTGANLNIYTGAPVAGLLFGGFTATNQWTSGVVIGSSIAVPAGGGITPENVKLMSRGAITGGQQANVNNAVLSGNNTFTLTGLNAVFPNGYKVYVYQNTGAGTGNTAGWGGNQFSTLGVTTFPDPSLLLDFGAQLQSQASLGAFANTWTPAAGNYFQTEITLAGDAPITADSFTVNQSVGHWQTGVNEFNIIAGIQIIGEVQDVVVPEPSAWPLFALGGVGMIIAFLYFRRRRATN